MADQTESSVVIDSAPGNVLAVIADFERYPQWAGAVKEVEILDRQADGRAARVRFTLDAGAVRDTYSLDYSWDFDADGVGELSWKLDESGVMRAMDGSYRLTPSGPGTKVTYTLAIDLRIPMLGMLRRKAEKAIVDTALTELKKHVES
ncbi:SRPBCC family protein [Kineosporia rhizophila]|uniref:SRPBCC family protein n=1 Tax=Kineosporia TaxID=49184 RepID=UPI000A724B3A|nr:MULTISPECIES: SRPBCC family protein [Kineosporia]MCE0538324.1 SRPBCC family protein [Kineosporia rhizophila]GLY18620.1 cyclase [Kineosporia sp. NBRC 101677]